MITKRKTPADEGFTGSQLSGWSRPTAGLTSTAWCFLWELIQNHGASGVAFSASLSSCIKSRNGALHNRWLQCADNPARTCGGLCMLYVVSTELISAKYNSLQRSIQAVGLLDSYLPLSTSFCRDVLTLSGRFLVTYHPVGLRRYGMPNNQQA